jgi:hypothetical protein
MDSGGREGEMVIKATLDLQSLAGSRQRGPRTQQDKESRALLGLEGSEQSQLFSQGSVKKVGKGYGHSPQDP